MGECCRISEGGISIAEFLSLDKMTGKREINYWMLITICLSFFFYNTPMSKSQTPDQSFEVRVSVKKKLNHYLNIVKIGQVVKTFSVDKLADLGEFDHADAVKILACKKVKNVYYILFWYEYRSTPSKNGQGFCGDGYEEFVASLQLS